MRDIALVCVVAVCALLLVATWLSLRTNSARPDPVEQAWQRWCRRLAKRVRVRAPSEAPLEYAAAVAELRPDLGAAVGMVTEHYLRLRYDGVPTAEETRNFARLVRELRVPRAPLRG